ncbi:Inosose isomerase [Novipirellula aureliae]|uniref:Inosose isomerase n=1 Tax=Novipirellula aureliae TaxID=2527966 RepID=A0A5C6DWT2_9BACT|nr:sugar phosphate isomerase/epimerase family protein [Novipirellula aureliae]TWU40357.1 Inosose isomerase [Novipirellula aureliae]
MLAINQLSTLRWSFAEDAHAYASRGFTGIGIYRPKLEDFGLDRTIELLAETALAVTSLSWVGGFTGSDGRGFSDAVADAINAVRDAANLQAGTLVVLAGGQNNHIRNHARRTLCDALREIVEVAEEFGVRLSLEPIHPGCGDEWSFVNDLQSTLDIIETVDSPSLGLVLDTYHVGMDEEVVRWLPDVVPHLHLVQLGDARHSPLGEMNRCLLGDGCVPIRTILDTLREQEYDGPYEIELIGEDVESLSYESILDHAKLFMDRITDRVNQP